MATYYVGPGGSDSNNGLSWATRKLTLNGAEDIPVAAGDLVYVGAGVYRHTLTCDVSGSSGNPITYVGDVTGALTDGVGGVVRITGSNNDQTATRDECIYIPGRDYRTFRGFVLDMPNGNAAINVNGGSNLTVEDCHFAASANYAMILGGGGTGYTIRRCTFVNGNSVCLVISNGTTVSNAGHFIEDCLFVGYTGRCINIERVGGITFNNCTWLGNSQCIRIGVALAAGQTTTVRNCIFASSIGTALQAATNPATNEEITEDYNTFFGGGSNRNNVSTGSNSQSYPPLFAPPNLLDGYQLPWMPVALSQWSPVRRLAGTSMASEDLFGIARPATASKVSWGAVQYSDKERETTTVRTGAGALKLADAGVHQMIVKTSNVSTTISVYVQWEADYAGTLPQLIVKQPGQSDQTDTATGSAGNWEQLSVTFTPAALPGYCVVELRSNNTATSGNFDCFFDDLVVS